VVDEHMHTSTLNVYSAGDVALAYNVIARRRIPAEHWCDAAQQGLVAGLSAAGHQAACNKAPEFSCTMGESTLNADDDYRRADQLVRSHTPMTI
jgi:3-phenylpropionate/trans-cinnamate dioxygenase ferredoxin reductase component